MLLQHRAAAGLSVKHLTECEWALVGDLDCHTSSALLGHIELYQPTGPVLWLDCAHVKFIDSGGWSVLQAIRDELEPHTAVSICNPSPSVQLLVDALGPF